MHFSIFSHRCFIDHQFQPATIFIQDGKIVNIAEGYASEKEANVHLDNQVVMAGIIDAHVHINEPGRTDWEGFDTATQAAAAGGITTLIDMPLNSSPVSTNVQHFQLKLDASQGKLNVNCGFYGGIVPQNLDELESLIQAGVLGIKAFLVHSGIDEFENVSEADLDKAMPLLAKYNIPLLVHCELESGDYAQNLRQEPTNYQFYLESRPKSWENKAVELMIRLCRKHRCPVHIVHVSSAEALELIAAAKQEGLPLTAETCPQYLYFHSEAIPNGNTLYKCAPPIREQANNQLLKEAFKSGILNFVATDHSPAPANLKGLNDGNFLKAWGGIAGLQFLLPVAWTALRDTLTLEQFIPLVTEHPARFLGIETQKGSLKIGADADITVWNPNAQFTIQASDVLFKHKISPYIGQTVFGAIHSTYVHGHCVFSNNQINQKNAGTWLLKK